MSVTLLNCKGEKMGLSTIVLSGITFYMKLDNYVLQHIQEKYESLMEFELLLIGAKKRINEQGKTILVQVEPKVEVINDILPMMIAEGMKIQGEKLEYSAEDIVRLIDKNIYVMADLVHQEFKKAIAVENPKKEMPSLIIRMKKTEKRKSIFSRFMSWVCHGLGLEKEK